MTTIRFGDLRVNDNAPPLTVEEAFRNYGSWAGIHNFNFNRLLDIPSATANVSGITGTGWVIEPLYDALAGPNMMVRYHKTQKRHGIVLNSVGNSLYFEILFDSNGYPSIEQSGTIRYSIPVPTPAEADVDIVFRQQQLNDNQDIIWRSITIYMNGRWITSWSDYYTEAFGDIQVGLIAHKGDTVEFTDLVVPELHDTIEYGALDPGETAMGGLQRTMEGRYLQFFMRHDGTIRAWKKKQRDVVYDFTNNPFSFSKQNDHGALITHARMMGAYIWSEAIDEDLIRKFGHRFQEVDNSMLLTTKECTEEANNELKRSQEAAFMAQVESHHVPLIEPEDRVETDGQTWIITDISTGFNRNFIGSQFDLRKYVWG